MCVYPSFLLFLKPAHDSVIICTWLPESWMLSDTPDAALTARGSSLEQKTAVLGQQVRTANCQCKHTRMRLQFGARQYKEEHHPSDAWLQDFLTRPNISARNLVRFVAFILKLPTRYNTPGRKGHSAEICALSITSGVMLVPRRSISASVPLARRASLV